MSADGSIPLTLPEAAALLMAALRRRGWVFSLDPLGGLHVIAGDPLDGQTVTSNMEAINLLQSECRLILTFPRGVH